MLILESIISRYLALDPEVKSKLAAFDGKVVKLEITGLNQNGEVRPLYLFPGGNGIQVLQEYDGTVDTVLRGSPVALFKMGLLKNTASLLLKGEVEISGDTRLGHQFKAIFSQMDIDWSEPLSELVGDELAYQLQQSSKQFVSWGKEAVRSFGLSISEYLQEESRDIVTDTELDIFNNEVDRVRESVDRLQARVNLLSESSSKSSKP
jgi:ubiquinone biosynthesis protein UbiJ